MNTIELDHHLNAMIIDRRSGKVVRERFYHT